MKLIFSVVILFFTAGDGNIFSAIEEENISAFVNNVIECRQIPGLIMSVVKNGDSWTRGFGIADVSTGLRVDETTIFAIASLGKAFTMTFMKILLEETGYQWTTKLSDINGLDLTFVNEQLTRNATLEDLLAHRTGLSSVNDYGFVAGYPAGTDRAYMSRRLKYLPETESFRSSFVYNNMMYMVLGHVIEVLGKDSWENLVTSRLLEPIGMDHSMVLMSVDDILGHNSAKPYIVKDGRLQDGDHAIYKLTPSEPALSILSNAVDMATWMRFNLNNGTISNGKHLVDSTRFADAFETHNEVPSFIVNNLQQPQFPVDDNTTGYGFGWLDSTYRGLSRKWHSGQLFSYVSLLWLYPNEKIGVFVNTNGPAIPSVPGLGLQAILTYVSDILLGQKPWLNLTTGCTFPSPWQKQFTSPIPPQPTFTNDNLTDFVGIYGNPLLPDIEITVIESKGNESENSLYLNWNRIKGELLPTAEGDVFGFLMTEPWEYAIECAGNENFTITYKVAFERMENGDVYAFDIFLSMVKGLSFRKDVRFLSDDDVRDAASTFKYCIAYLLVCAFILLKVTTHLTL